MWGRETCENKERTRRLGAQTTAAHVSMSKPAMPTVSPGAATRDPVPVRPSGALWPLNKQSWQSTASAAPCPSLGQSRKMAALVPGVGPVPAVPAPVWALAWEGVERFWTLRVTGSFAPVMLTFLPGQHLAHQRPHTLFTPWHTAEKRRFILLPGAGEGEDRHP